MTPQDYFDAFPIFTNGNFEAHPCPTDLREFSDQQLIDYLELLHGRLAARRLINQESFVVLRVIEDITTIQQRRACQNLETTSTADQPSSQLQG